jgi:hypothetical protein
MQQLRVAAEAKYESPSSNSNERARVCASKKQSSLKLIRSRVANTCTRVDLAPGCVTPTA